jgi:SAM-dependent methyltransferase
MRELLSRTRRALKEKRVRYVVRFGVFHPMKISAECLYHRLFRSFRTFTFQGSRYHYIFHKHNTTWRNERCVEIPIIWKILEEHQGKEVLEVGNVLSHYFPVKHDVIDKYEVFNGVVNQDVVDFRPSKRYDLIVSISTMEHVGWDEDPRDQSKILGEPVKILRALGNLQECLAPGGMIVITIPVGYNPQLDKSLVEGKIVFSKRLCLKRVSRNKWVESDWAECIEARYGTPYTAANALVILFTSKR